MPLKNDLDGSWTPYKAVGGDVCKGTGYNGGVGIYQVMKICDALKRIIMTTATPLTLPSRRSAKVSATCGNRDC